MRLYSQAAAHMVDPYQKSSRNLGALLIQLQITLPPASTSAFSIQNFPDGLCSAGEI